MSARAAIRRPRAAARAAIALALALGACSHAPTGDRPLANRGGAVPADAAPPPPDAEPACVTACVAARQMEAVSIDYIRASCARQCSAPPPALP